VILYSFTGTSPTTAPYTPHCQLENVTIFYEKGKKRVKKVQKSNVREKKKWQANKHADKNNGPSIGHHQI